MPITILDYVKDQIGEKTTYTAEDFSRAGVDIIGGCEVCGATLAGYNAYPAKSGYWRCADCIYDDGFATAEDFINFIAAEKVRVIAEVAEKPIESPERFGRAIDSTGD